MAEENMANTSGNGDNSSFSGYSYEQLCAMLANAKADPMHTAADALTKAQTDLSALAEELKAHVDNVQWSGKGAEAFRKWGHDMANETHRMAEYVKDAGSAIGNVGTGINAGKSKLPPAAEMCYVDPKLDQASKAPVEQKRQAAIQALEAVDSHYTASLADFGKLKEPNFPPLPGGLGYDDGPEVRIGAPAPGGGFAAGDEVAARRSPYVSHPTGHDNVLNPSGENGSNTPMGSDTPASHPTGTHIDSTATLPSHEGTRTHPSTPLPDGDTRVHPSGVDRLPTVPVPPTAPRVPSSEKSRTLPTLPRTLPTTPGTLPTEPLPGQKYPQGEPRASRTAVPVTGMRDEVVGGLPGRAGSPPAAARLPRGTVIGAEPLPGARGPIGTGGPGASGPEAVGGQGGGARRFAQGNVVGQESNALARGPMGAGMHPVSGAGGTSGSRGTMRRLASEPGGIARAPRSGQGRTEFTTGGTGLVREAHLGDARSARGTGRDRQREQRNRQAEQEGSSTDTAQRTAPPVIE
ncbi:hypothetical protein ACIHFE_08225 [Streptomyces sp. NPDC052396]|uniref:hypothetical protein n=1 Tax=Streptomyces sp. NPDC052396 TaxID=3365689 RepID=UPI0037CE63BA